MFCKPGFDFLVHALYTIPSNYLEIGVFNSDSIANIATIYPSKKIYGIDPFIEDGYTSHVTDVNRGELLSQQKQNTLNNIKDLQNIVLLICTSKKVHDIITPEIIDSVNIGAVLIDGSHHYEDVSIDVELSMKLIGKKPGFIIFDDTDVEGVKMAQNEFLEKYEKQISLEYILTPNIIGYRLN